MLDYLKHFDDYYGQGEHSEERKQAVRTFCRFAVKSEMNIHSLMQVVNKLDTGPSGYPARDNTTPGQDFRKHKQPRPEPMPG